jgi:hypothetical protein
VSPELDIVIPTAKTREFEAKGVFQPANLCRAVLMRNQYVRLACLWPVGFASPRDRGCVREG